MPDGRDREPNVEAAFPFWGSQAPASLQEIQQGMARAWCLMLASQTDQALSALGAIERQVDDLSPSVATRYRAATEVLRLSLVAFQDKRLSIPAIVIALLFVERGASLGMLEEGGSMESLEPMDHRPLAIVRSAGDGATPGGSASDAITARERDVLHMIGQGCSNKHIARRLEISPETVKSHVKHIFSKLDVTTRSEAVSRAVLLRLL
jgi:ATP/maltotriose-dependent transcriptional regulator MalT